MEEYLKNVTSSREYYTVSDYFLFLEKEHGIKRPKSKERRNFYQGTELECSSICKECDIIVEKEPNEEFGSINKYPEYILAEVIFGEAYIEYFLSYSPNLAIRYPGVLRKKPG
jgi:hypothetical protein